MEELETPLEGVSPDPAATPEKPAAEHAAEEAAGTPEPAPETEVSGEGAAAAAEAPAGWAGTVADGGAETAPAEVSVDELLASSEPTPVLDTLEDAQLRAVLEAIVYVAEEPLTLAQLASALQQPAERVSAILGQLVAEFDKPEHGVTIREVAGGYKMATKAEHHEAVRSFVKSLKPPLKLSLPALETLAVIAYKQPVTAPEIMEIRGVQGAGVLKTLLDRKVIAVAGRKNVIGKPILYKTTKEFLIQFGLKDLTELPSLKEFEEIRRMAFADSEPTPEAATVASPAPPSPSEPVVEPPADATGAEAALSDAGTVAAAEPEPVAASDAEPKAAPGAEPQPPPEQES